MSLLVVVFVYAFTVQHLRLSSFVVVSLFQACKSLNVVVVVVLLLLLFLLFFSSFPFIFLLLFFSLSCCCLMRVMCLLFADLDLASLIHELHIQIVVWLMQLHLGKCQRTHRKKGKKRRKRIRREKKRRNPPRKRKGSE